MVGQYRNPRRLTALLKRYAFSWCVTVDVPGGKQQVVPRGIVEWPVGHTLPKVELVV